MRAELGSGDVGVAWLGQAGFLVRSAAVRLVIDPYLSDSLAAKYRDKPLSHGRMMPAPIAPEELTSLDLVLCTHRHTDHMDPGTLPALARANPACRFVVPAAEAEAARQAGVPNDRLVAVDADQTHELHPRLTLHALPAAHETLERDDAGRHRYLGYAVTLANLTLYHSGDTVPFDGLDRRVRAVAPDVALLPVNGRGKGVAGNFTFDEAAALCMSVGIRHLIPHHFGLFAFNTADPADLAVQSAALPEPLRCTIPNTNDWYLLR